METFRCSLHAQQHCLEKKHWIGHEEVPVPACHQPALHSGTSHTVSLGLLQMRGLEETPKIPSANTNILRVCEVKEASGTFHK